MALEDDGAVEARAIDVLARCDDGAGRRLVESGEDVEDRRLAATRVAENAGELALADRIPVEMPAEESQKPNKTAAA